MHAVFGIGGESLGVAQNAYSVAWFKNGDLSAVMGLQLSAARLGSTVGINTVAPLYNRIANYSNFSGHTLLGVVLAFTAITCIFSLLATVVLAIIDRKVAKSTNRKLIEKEDRIRISDVKNFNISFWFLAAICVTYYIAVYPFVSLGT